MRSNLIELYLQAKWLGILRVLRTAPSCWVMPACTLLLLLGLGE